MKRLALYCFACLLAPALASAQQLWSVQLPTNPITAACYISDTAMYFGNANALKFYDGFAFRDADFYPLHDNVLRAMVSFNNRIWIGTNQGLAEAHGANTTVYNQAGGQLPGDTVLALATLGNLLFVGTNAGLAIFDGNSWQQLTSNNSHLPANRVSSLKVNQNQLGIAAGNFAARWSNGQIIQLGGPYAEAVGHVMPFVSNSYLITFPVGSALFLSTSGTVYTLDDLTEVGMVAANNVGNVLFFQSRGRFVEMTEDAYWWRALINPSFLFFNPTNEAWMVAGGFLRKFASMRWNDGQLTSRNSNLLDINQVEARYMAQGDMFWNREGNSMPHYKVPKQADSTSTLFAHNLWIGGLHSGIHYQSAQTYRQGGTGTRYNSGLLGANGEIDTASAWAFDRVWKVNRFDVEAFKQAWSRGEVQNGSFKPALDIREWPGNRPGSSTVLAPFFDRNADGLYSWQQGDYPLIKGDQAVWWVYHDRQTPPVTGTPALGMEVRCMAYAYVCEQATGLDSVINYTTFLDYEVQNFSNRTYDSAYFSLFVDGEIGYTHDDFIGTDVRNNGIYFYNAQAIDPTSMGYGANPPAQGIYVLRGPQAPAADGLDNNRNGQIDEAGEDWGISSSSMIFGGNGTPSGPPLNLSHHYNRSRSRFNDGVPMVFGGTGYPGSAGAVSNLSARYLFPGNSDSLGWTAGGNTQSPVFLPFAWSETNTGAGSNTGSDTKGMAYLGPFTFAPNQTENLSLAFVYSRGTNGPASSVTKLLTQDAPRIREWYAAGNFPSCLDLSTVGTRPIAPTADVQVYPNPARDRVTLAVGEGAPAQLVLLDAQGRVLLRQAFEAGQKHEINLSPFAPGVYLLHIQQGEGLKQLKLVKQ